MTAVVAECAAAICQVNPLQHLALLAVVGGAGAALHAVREGGR